MTFCCVVIKLIYSADRSFHFSGDAAEYIKGRSISKYHVYTRVKSLRDSVRQIIIQWRQREKGTLSAGNLACYSEVATELSLPIQLRAQIEINFLVLF